MNEHMSAPPAEVAPAPPQFVVPPKAARSSRGRWVWLMLLVAIAAAAYYLWPKVSGLAAGTTPAEAPAGKKGGRGGGPVPVVAARVHRGDIGVYITGLGNAIPIYTVTIKSRVDGQLMEIHYKEGDLVQKDDPLVELDPRPFKVRLEQA